MAAPIYNAAPAPGNLIPSSTSIGTSKTAAVLLDLTAAWQGYINCAMFTGSTTPSTTAGIKWEAFHIKGMTTLTASVSATGTSISVASAAGITVGTVIGLQKAGSPWTGGETVTVSAISGTTLTVSSLTYGYSAGDAVFLIAQTPSYSVTPGPASGSTYSASTPYSYSLAVQQDKLLLRATNLDGTSTTVTIEATLDTLT